MSDCKLNIIKNNLLSQDNRSTDQPMFVVEEEIKIGPFLDGYADEYEWFNAEELEYADSHLEHRLEQRLEAGADQDEEYKGWRRYGIRRQWEFVTACFTEQGCKDYIRINGHNLGKTRIYAFSSFRNEEYQFVRKMLMGAE